MVVQLWGVLLSNTRNQQVKKMLKTKKRLHCCVPILELVGHRKILAKQTSPKGLVREDTSGIHPLSLNGICFPVSRL